MNIKVYCFNILPVWYAFLLIYFAGNIFSIFLRNYIFHINLNRNIQIISCTRTTFYT